MNAIDRGWVAGFIEGDGYFIAGARPPAGSFVAVDQVNEEPLHRLAALCGGRVRPVRKAKGNCSAASRWMLCGAAASGLAFDIYPHMSIKRQQQITRAFPEVGNA